MSDTRHYARRPIGYDGKELDPGQVITLAGLRNDEKLVRLGYFEEFKGSSTQRCRLCGAEFTTQRFRQQHGDYRHVERDLTPEQQDAREETRQEQAPPLYLDKTAAAKGVKPTQKGA